MQPATSYSHGEAELATLASGAKFVAVGSMQPGMA
jgi:hypothetical protein